MSAAYDLDGKVVFVTGGAKGIGFETARQAAALGAVTHLLRWRELRVAFARSASLRVVVRYGAPSTNRGSTT